MHLSEGVLPAAHAAGFTGAAALAVAFSVRRLRRRHREGGPAERAVLTTGTALLFAATLLPIPVPVAGATSHLCATPLLGLLLGPAAVAAPAALVLLLQALFFAHGGLTTLGANVVSLGVVGPFAAAGLAALFLRARVPARVAAGVACAFGQLAVYAADAVLLGAGLAGERSFGFWVGRILAGFAPIQLPLAVVEGVLSAALLGALARRRPEVVPSRLRGPLPVVAVAALVCGLSLLPRAAAAVEPLRGADEAVLEEAARAAGRTPAAPAFEPGEEIGMALLLSGGFAAGWFAHRGVVVLGRATVDPGGERVAR